MSLETNAKPLPKNKTERRNTPQTEAQRISSTENFALFLLAGMLTAINNPRAKAIFSNTAVNRIVETIKWEVDRIKALQQMRKDGK